MNRYRAIVVVAAALAVAIPIAATARSAPARPAAARSATARSTVARSAPDRVPGAIARALARGEIDAASAASFRTTYKAALDRTRMLGGIRRRELGGVVAIVRGLAARGTLTASRMPFVFLTLQRNVDWWSVHGPPAPGSAGEPGAQGRRCAPLAHGARVAAAAPRAPLAVAARVTFPGSGIQWEYYPGMGLQLQVNGTFAAANALLRQATPQTLAQAGAILDEMTPLASQRGGVTTWEYEFPFDGGEPPWTSSLSQATAIEAYTTAAAKLSRPAYLSLARRLAVLFAVAPSTGVRLRLARDGNWYLLYDFDSHQRVLNAQLDALIALFDLATATGDPQVAYLEREGMRAARRHIARFDTGRWSRYAEGGPIADLNYHVLNRDLARSLCQRTGQAAICSAWHSYTRELEQRCPKPGAPIPTGPTGPTGPSGPSGPSGASGQQNPPAGGPLGGVLGPS